MSGFTRTFHEILSDSGMIMRVNRDTDEPLSAESRAALVAVGHAASALLGEQTSAEQARRIAGFRARLRQRS